MAKMNKIKFLSQIKAPNLRNLTTADDYWGLIKALNTIYPNYFLSISYGTKVINTEEFAGNTNYKNVAIPYSVSSIGARAFRGCTNLTGVYIPESVTSIGDNAFYDCSALVSVNIPDSVTSIGAKAFSGCNNLSRVIIQDNVSGISADAFEDLSVTFYTNSSPSAAKGFPWGANSEYSSIHYNGCDGTECDKHGCIVKSEAHEHDSNVILSAKAATCTETGLTEGRKCSICNMITVPQQVTGTIAHQEVTISGKAATCVTTGLTDGKECSVCGTTTVEQTVIPKNANNHTNIVIDSAKAATCTSTGLSEGSHCSACNTVIVAQQTIDTIAHTPQSSNNGYAATCTKEGKTSSSYCSVCNQILTQQEVIPAAGHSYGNLISKVEAVHTADTLTPSVAAHYYCAACNTYFTEAKEVTTIEALTGTTPEHTYGTWKSSDDVHWKECSCGKKSNEGAHVNANGDSVCDICNATIVAPHVCSGTKQAGKQATCEEAGYNEYYKCSCGKYYEDANCTKLISDIDTWKLNAGKIATLEHTYKYVYDADGYHINTCSVCGATSNSELCSTVYKNNENHHWTYCSACGHLGENGNHVWDAKYDATQHWEECKVCGRTTTKVAHDFELKQDTVGYGHYGVCKTCGYESARTQHTAGAAATCTTPQTCTECGYVINAATGHGITKLVSNADGSTHSKICLTCNNAVDSSDCYVYESATCTSAAKCECGRTIGEPLGHSYPSANYVYNNDATCGKDGTKTAQCANGCGTPKTIVAANTATGQHVWNAGKVTTEASCTNQEVTTFTCTVCNGTKTEVTGGYNHSNTYPSSNNDGTHNILCYECDGVASSNVACTVKTAATCESPAKCACGYSIGAALGHTFGTYTYDNNATCTKDGTNTAKCKTCGATDTVTATGTAKHIYDSVVVTPATCTTGGYTTHTCVRCGDSYKDTYTDPNGHKYGDWVTDTDATCAEAGTKHKTCENCGDVLTGTINATGHNYLNVEEAGPTCTDDGYILYRCSTCGDEKTENNGDATGHDEYTVDEVESTCISTGHSSYTACHNCDWTEGYEEYELAGHTEVIDEAVEAGCDSTGLTEGSHCSVCGETIVEQEETESLGHDWVVDEAVAPTCTDTGLSEGSHCDRCGFVQIEQNEVPADSNAHDYESDFTEPTCEDDGGTVYTCKNCGASYSEIIPATGHDWGEAYEDDGLGETLYAHDCKICGAMEYIDPEAGV